MTEPKTEIVTAQWPKALADEAREAARQHDRSLSWVIRQAVREWLDAWKGERNAD